MTTLLKSSLFGLLSVFSINLSAQISLPNVDSAFAWADRQSLTVEISNQQSLLAKWTRVAAQANTVNFRSPITFSSTDNTQLAVSFIPAEIFGGPKGTFKQITMGQQYVSNFNFNPQIDIVNAQNWAKVKSAKLNESITALDAQINLRNLKESVAAAYWNIVSLKNQLAISKESLKSADSVLASVKRKYDAGLVREQDKNNALINKLMTQDKIGQLEASLKTQQNALKILLNLPENSEIEIPSNPIQNATLSNPASDLLAREARMKTAFAQAEYQATKAAFLPTLTGVYYKGWQQNSNTGFFNSANPWIPNQYVGLRVSMPFPPDVSKVAGAYTSKVQAEIQQLSADNAAAQEKINQQNMVTELQKLEASVKLTEEIAALKQSNFFHAQKQFEEGLLSTDNLLNAFSDKLNSDANLAQLKASLNFQRSKINLYQS